MSRREATVMCVALVAAIFVLAALVALSVRRYEDELIRRREVEARLVWLQAKCDQNADGSAVCERAAFDPVLTTPAVP